jgi:hypothetical protein
MCDFSLHHTWGCKHVESSPRRWKLCTWHRVIDVARSCRVFRNTDKAGRHHKSENSQPFQPKLLRRISSCKLTASFATAEVLHNETRCSNWSRYCTRLTARKWCELRMKCRLRLVKQSTSRRRPVQGVDLLVQMSNWLNFCVLKLFSPTNAHLIEHIKC